MITAGWCEVRKPAMDLKQTESEDDILWTIALILLILGLVPKLRDNM
jgi:hypothetical protein